MTRTVLQTVLSRTLVALGLLALLAGAVTLALRLAGGPQEEGIRATLSATGAIAGADTAGFARAMAPRPFVFPEDHGAHPAYRTEWWYLTGNLTDADGRRFAWQLTFFRNSLSPEPPARASSWSTNQLWMAHFALTDVESGRHRAFERFARGAVGLAGAEVAETEPLRVWLDDWELRGSGGADAGTAGGAGSAGTAGGGPSAAVGSGISADARDVFPLTLVAQEEGWAIELTLDAGKPIVLQGDRGWSRKGPEPGNASYYYSFTRMPARGRVTVEGRTLEVEGTSWMDREWSTSALGSGQVGWDWFSLQLSDGRELMFFELRRADGRPEPLDHGVLVEPDGSYRTLPASAFDVEVIDHWTSPLDGARYPSGWRVRVPLEGIDLEVTPVVRDQEMNLSVRYWEGAVEVRGTGVEGQVAGVGFVELTGYGEAGGRGVR